MGARVKKIKASVALGIYTPPFTETLVDAGAAGLTPGSLEAKRFAESIIGAHRSDTQRKAIDAQARADRAQMNAEVADLVLTLMGSVETLLRDRYGESHANRVADLTFEDAMVLLDASVGEIPASFRDGIREWRLSNPGAKVEAPEIAE